MRNQSGLALVSSMTTMSEMGHSRPGGTNGSSTHVRFAPKAELNQSSQNLSVVVASTLNLMRASNSKIARAFRSSVQAAFARCLFDVGRCTSFASAEAQGRRPLQVLGFAHHCAIRSPLLT